MSQVTHEPGMFIWTDIGLPDQDAGKRFYTGLFGWSAEDIPMGEGGTYSMMSRAGDEAAGIYPQPEEQQAAGVPPMWLSYILVDDVDATAEKVTALGATVHAEPFDVMDVGRMSLIVDPTGAMVALWQAAQPGGSSVFNEPGSMTWNELATRDVDRAKEFYSALLGWTFQEDDAGGFIYHTILRGPEAFNGGMMQMDERWPEGLPSHWMVYFSVDDVDASAAKVEELGGKVRVPPMDVPVGRLAIVSDPQGGTFSIIKLTNPTG